MVRRLKADLRRLGEAFPERNIEAIRIAGLPEDAPELELARRLAALAKCARSALRTARPKGVTGETRLCRPAATAALVDCSICPDVESSPRHLATRAGRRGSSPCRGRGAGLRGRTLEGRLRRARSEDDSAEQAIDAEDGVEALVRKTETIREELGCLGQVIEDRIAKRLAESGIGADRDRTPLLLQFMLHGEAGSSPEMAEMLVIVLHGLQHRASTHQRRIGLPQQLNGSQEVRIRPRPELKPGTRLVREWQGRTYDVLVLDDGFSWQGMSYRSLSALAGKITGTAWSGPLFFGLKANRTAALRSSRGPRSAREDGDAAS